MVTAGNIIGYTENAAPISISPGLTVVDPDNANLSGAVISISNGFLAGDNLGFVNQNGITGNYDTGTGVLTLSGSSSGANYQTALRSVTFSSSSDNPTASGANPSRTISFVVNDGLASSAAATSTINVTSVNDNPVAGADTIQRAANDDTKVKVATLLLNDSDPDGGTLSITGVSSSTPGVTVTLSGEWVLYKHGTTTADSFTYTLIDGQGGTIAGTVNVAIQGPDTQAGPALQLTVDGTITFHALAGRTYIMQRAPDPVAGPWTDHGTATEASRGVYTYTATAGFYRAVYR